MSALVRAALMMVVGLSLPALAHAGIQNVPCDRPFVFEGAAVNVVVLPFSAPRALASQSDEIGRRLAALVQRETLLSIVSFGSVGAVQLVGDPEAGCTPEVVLAKLTGREPGARSPLAAGRGLVMVWGRLYADGDEIYLQTFVRFLRHGVDEAVTLPVGAGRSVTLRPSTQAFACVPRRIARADLDRIDAAFAEADLVRSAPGGGVARQIPPDVAFSYYVTEVRDDWMHIRTHDGDIEGWVRARTDTPEWSLRRWMPELSFVRGVVGYLAYQVARSANGSAPAAYLDLAEEAMKAYMTDWLTGAAVGDAAPGGAQALALAVPYQLRSMMLVLRHPSDAAARTRAIGWLQRARRHVPWSGQALTMVASLRAFDAFQRNDLDEAYAALDDTLGALGLEPDNRTIQEDVQVLLEALVQRGPPQPPPVLTTPTGPTAPNPATPRERYATLDDKLAAIRTLRARQPAPPPVR